MSTTALPPTPASAIPPANPQQLQAIRTAREIEQLAFSGLPPQQFFEQLLEKVVSTVAATGGAVWLLEQGRLNLCCNLNLQASGITASSETQTFHQRLLGEVAGNGQTRLLHTDDEPQVPFPKRHLLFLASLQANGTCRGIVEIFQRPDVPAAARAGFLQFIEQMTGYASLFLERAETAQPATTSTTFDDDIGRFALQLQRSLRLNDVAAITANDGRVLAGCDRVSVLIQRGRKLHVQAVSGQESVHARSNLVNSMIRLSREVLQSGVVVKYTGKTDSFAPQVKERLADFVQESGARMVFVVPLQAPAPLVAVDPQVRTSAQGNSAFGCLVLEQFSQSEPARALTDRLEWFTGFAASALYNARMHQSIFLLPLWTMLGRTTDWMHGRKLLKALMFIGLIIGVASILGFGQADLRVEGEGRLMPVIRREVFVPYDGDVVDVLVASGDRVVAGQLLVKLRNNDLRSELVATLSQLEEKRKLRGALLAERDDAVKGPTGERTNRIEGELAKTVAELSGLEQQLQVLRERERLLDVVSPISGVVSTFEVDQLLRNRPVRRGEVMLEVMDDNGPWQLELNVDEHRTGHVFQAREASSTPLAIEYLLVTSPETTHHATLKELGTRVEMSEDHRSVVELLASPDDEPGLSRRIGSEIRARIHCGRTNLAYVLFGDVIEFVQKYLWL